MHTIELQKRRNFLDKFLLKVGKPAAYILYKLARQFDRSVGFDQTHLPIIPQNTTHRAFKHAGNPGDLIHALPTVLALQSHLPNHFYLHLGQKGGDTKHPLGGVTLNQKIAEMLIPLLEAQPYFDKVGIYENQPIDYNLDLFRELPLNLYAGDISRWYFYVFNVNYDLSKPWLSVSPDNQYNNAIVWARSERYFNPHFDYSFLKKYKSVIFVGIEQEYKRMKAVVPNLVWQPVNNFLEMAQIIAGAKLFIGNQSLPYSLAEAMKVPRILEGCYYAPTVVIHGENGYDAYFQKNLEAKVQELYGR
jgi:hypothetical protein